MHCHHGLLHCMMLLDICFPANGSVCVWYQGNVTQPVNIEYSVSWTALGNTFLTMPRLFFAHSKLIPRKNMMLKIQIHWNFVHTLLTTHLQHLCTCILVLRHIK